MKNILLTLISLAFGCACLISCVDEEAVAVARLDDGQEVLLPVSVCKMKDGAVRFMVDKDDIPAEAKEVSIHLECAEVKAGSDGFWIVERGRMGDFKQSEREIYQQRDWLRLPYFGLKTPKKTFIAIMEGMRFEFDLYGSTVDGVYKFYPNWVISQTGFGAYENPSVLLYELPDKADYNEMAKTFRRYVLDRNPEMLTTVQKSASRPHVGRMAQSLALRQTVAAKEYFDKSRPDLDFTPETEHRVLPFISFEKTLELLQTLKNEYKVEDVAVCMAGWQTGGYDGRCPATFPVCVEVGGEAALKQLIAGAQDLGYIIDGHSNYTDCFSVSPLWDNGQIACVGTDGTYDSNGVWRGGRAYNLCLAHTKEMILSDLEKIADLGYYGAHYIDVFSAAFPYRCCNPQHPANRNQIKDIQIEIAKFCRNRFGGFASECCFDHMLPYVDYINYVESGEGGRRIREAAGKKLPGTNWDRLVPFFELAFHDYVITHPDKSTQGVPEGDDYLMLVEFGGRPIIYDFDKFGMEKVAHAYKRFQPLKHLMTEEMLAHKILDDGVACVTYSNGDKVVVNYNESSYVFEGYEIPAKDYIIVR